MHKSFHHVTQSLRSDSGAPAALSLAALALLAICWVAWAFESRVPLYAVSHSAHIEASPDVPNGHFFAAAEFPTAAALGKIRPGQPATLRFDAFPWTQYGTIPATVSRVDTQSRNGTLRVELALSPAPSSSIPLQQGLPGSVEIELERVSPAALLLRSAGALAAKP